MTEIQRKGIPLALAKRDVLGAAKTGSGKTLTFLIPVLEILFRQQWNAADGLGALIISPTRELAVQIFEVLKKIGRTHTFSAGLIIGGKEFKVEQERIARMNILVCTPGRLLQHMDQSVGFSCDNLQVLVLDEADRIMDMGFQNTMNAIIENLPPQRQTLMFSATQTRSVKDLARLSLRDPEYVAVHEKAEHSTPKTLSQHYVVTELPKKLDVLYSFIKTHLKSKTIVFLSSCKQTRFVFESFCKLQPGVPIMHLHGKQKQTKRVDIFRKFTSSQHAVLLCTDIAARGLDFPAVDWVVQLDCPEDADTYIHRVGRTARFDADGHALLILVPSEVEGMTEELKKKRVPIEEIKIRNNKQQTIQKQLQSFCFQDPEIKYLAQRAFVAYMRSVYLQRNKTVFDVTKLPAEEFALSLGLVGAPKIKFVKKAEKKMGARKPEEEKEEEEEEEEEEEKSTTKEQKTKYDRMFQRKNQDILSEHYNKLVDYEGDKIKLDDNDEDDEDFLTIQRVDHDLESDNEEDISDLVGENISKRKLKMTKKERVKTMPRGEKVLFDEEGNAHAMYELVDEEDFLKEGDVKSQIKAFIEEKGEAMQTADKEDKEIAKQKRLEKKIKRKERERAAMKEEMGEAYSSEEENDEDLAISEEEEEVSSEMSEEETDRKRKWFEDSEEEEETSSKKRIIDIEEPQTLEDQEALALKLLGA
ncbi:P-loop containing nucleoside triphosphate hydrolase protein [Cokeromyces recurvatus]|uniref:P-loop containing nucleoside triphosphate hydrolase protein n=1 Tax=Cokeromyces recurvatus TaxID=90255 RepID=UPI00221F1A67|nr:P-loop containing nucleoside triphosphate hydrolase protein [Cokeromyces recurvatus]KAI7904778.1 P-loop containing nucleoside triphosphate hydrolase protein [Cokeromyces recurvatus]